MSLFFDKGMVHLWLSYEAPMVKVGKTISKFMLHIVPYLYHTFKQANGHDFVHLCEKK